MNTRQRPKETSKEMRSFSAEVYKFDVSSCPYTNAETNEIQEMKKQRGEMMNMRTGMTEGKELDIQKDKDKLKRSQAGMSNIQDSVYEQGGKFKEIDHDPKKNPRKRSYKEAHVPDPNGIHRFVSDTGQMRHYHSVRLVVPSYPSPLQPPYPELYDFKAHCEYHAGIRGHSIEDCIAFKRRVQKLIQCKILRFKNENELATTIAHPTRVEPKEFEVEKVKNQTLEHGNKVNMLIKDRDDLKKELKSLQENYQELRSAFKGVGLGDTLDQWKKGVIRLKKESELWKRNSKTNENQISTLTLNLQAIKDQCTALKEELKGSQATCELLNMCIRLREETMTELKEFQAKVEAQKKQVDGRNNIILMYKDLVDDLRKTLQENIEKWCCQLQDMDKKIKRKYNHMKDIIATAQKVARKVVDLAGATKEISQNKKFSLGHD
ncbi:hypothetical protein GQ457_07G000380 [Hibiscus cannabinus]